MLTSASGSAESRGSKDDTRVRSHHSLSLFLCAAGFAPNLYHSTFGGRSGVGECTNGSSKGPKAVSYWTVLGHMSVPQPVTVAYIRDCSDWLNLAIPALEARSTP